MRVRNGKYSLLVSYREFSNELQAGKISLQERENVRDSLLVSYKEFPNELQAGKVSLQCIFVFL